MLWTPPNKGRLRYSDSAASIAQPYGVSVTTGGASTTKGTPAELFSAIAFDCYMLVIAAQNVGANTTASESSIDILVGAATESILIADLLAGGAGNLNGISGRGPKVWAFPLYIPEGTRIAVQAASVKTATAFTVNAWIYGGKGYPIWPVASKVVTYGMGTVPRGTSITPAASGTPGAYTQITAATTEDHIAVIPSFQCSTDTTMNGRNYLVEIGEGAATESSIGQWLFTADSNEMMDGPIPCFPSFIDIPSGTRLALRATNNSSNDAAYDAVIHALSA